MLERTIFEGFHPDPTRHLRGGALARLPCGCSKKTRGPSEPREVSVIFLHADLRSVSSLPPTQCSVQTSPTTAATRALHPLPSQAPPPPNRKSVSVEYQVLAEAEGAQKSTLRPVKNGRLGGDETFRVSLMMVRLLPLLALCLIRTNLWSLLFPAVFLAGHYGPFRVVGDGGSRRLGGERCPV